MTLRDLTEKQVHELRLIAECRLKERQKFRSVPLNPIDYKLAFSDGAKAILSWIEKLP